jgi:hypothetical protein
VFRDASAERTDDYAALRQLLVAEGLLERDAGVYRRPGVTAAWGPPPTLAGAGR